MTGGLMMSGARLALLAASGLFVVGAATAQAADLGGNCCADLEERVAELEATTVRKGNRKVKLEISGHINEAIMWWDDGRESNVYQVTNDNSRSRFRFKGEATIADGWKAGYLIEVGIRTANSKRVTQDDDEGSVANAADVGLDLRHSYWFVDSKTYGRGTVGHTGGAGEGVTEINLAQTKDVAKWSDQEDTGYGLAIRQTNGLYLNNTNTVQVGSSQAFTWRRLIRDNGDQPGEGRRYNLVKYDTPEIAGFNGTANWGEDDIWEMGLRYKGEFSGLKVAGGVAYGENSEQQVTGGQVGFECLAQGTQTQANTGKDADCHQFGGSISVMHESTGIYVNLGAGILTDELITRSNAFIGVAGTDNESTFWALEAGIERKWHELGKTTLFAQYYDNDGGSNARRTINVGGVTSRVLDTELQSYGVGVVQGIDNAAMMIYLFYRHSEADITSIAGTAGAGAINSPSLEDLDVVMSGAIIKF